MLCDIVLRIVLEQYLIIILWVPLDKPFTEFYTYPGIFYLVVSVRFR